MTDKPLPLTIVAPDPVLRGVLTEAVPRYMPGTVVAAAPSPGPVLFVAPEGQDAGTDVMVYPLRLGQIADRAALLADGARVSWKRGETVVLAPGYGLTPDDSLFVDEAAGRRVRLTEKERDILLALARQPDGFLDRGALLATVWGYQADGIETHTLETHIYRLRQKIERDPASPLLLLTDEAGYRLRRD